MTSFTSADTRPNNHPVSPASGYGHVVGTGSRFLGEGTLTLPRGFREQIYQWTLPSIDEYLKMVLGGNLPALAVKIFAEKPEFFNAFPTPDEWKRQLDPAFECFGEKIKDIVDEAWAGTLDTTVIQKLAELDALLTSILNEVFPTPEEIANAVEEALQEVKAALQSLCSALNGQSDAIISAMVRLIPALTQALLALIPSANEAWHSIYDPIRNIIPTAAQLSDAILSPISDALPSSTEISEAINDVVDAVGVELEDVSQQILDQLRSAIPNAEALVAQMVQAFINAFPTQAQIMSAAEGAVRQAIDSALNGIADQITNLISGTIPKMFPGGLSQLLPGAVNVIGGAIGQFCNIVSSAANTIISAITSAMALIQALPVILCNPTGISTVIGAASAVVTSAMSVLNSINVPAGIAPKVTVLAGNALQLGVGIASAINGMFSGLSSKMSSLFNGLNLGNSIASAVFTALRPLYDIPETALNNIINTIKQNLLLIESLANTVVNIARTAMASLKTALSGVLSAVASLFDPIVAVVTSIIANLSALLNPLLHPENLVNTISDSIVKSFNPDYGAILSALLLALSPLSQIITSLGAIWDQLQVIVARLASRLISILNRLFNFDGVIERIKSIFNSFFKDWLDAPDIIKQTWSCLCDVLPEAIDNLFFKDGKPLSVTFLENLFRQILEPLFTPARELLKTSLENYWNSACMYPPTSSGSVYMHTEDFGLTYKCLGKSAYKVRGGGQWEPADRFLWTIKTTMKGDCKEPKPKPFFFMVPSPAPDPIKFMASFINALAKSTFKLIETLLCKTIDGSLGNIFEKVFKRIYEDLAELTSTTIASAGRVAGKLLELAVDLSEGMVKFVVETFGQITAKSFSTIIEIADFITSCAYKLLIDVIKSGLPRILSECVKGLWNAITRAIPNYIASAALAPMAAACDILNSITGGILKAVVKFFTELAPGLAQALINSSVHLITEVVPRLVGEVCEGVASVLKDINFNLWKSMPLAVYRTFKDMFPRAIAGAIGASFCMPQSIAKALAGGVGGLFSKAFGAFGDVFTGSLGLGAFDFSALASALSSLTEQIINCLLKLMPAVGQLAALGVAGAVKVASFVDSMLPTLNYFFCPPAPTQKTISYCDGTDTKQIIVLSKPVAAT
jgi:phage-related protein